MVFLHAFDVATEVNIGITKVSTNAGRFAGFDVVVSGDNHKSFEKRLKNGALVVNCGGFYRRRSDEVENTPRIGRLHADGSVSFVPLATGDDKVCTVGVVEEPDIPTDAEVATFVEGLVGLETKTIDFKDALLRALEAKGVTGDVRKVVLEALG